MSPMHDPRHPIWPLANLAVIATSSLIALWIFATQFDETEWKSLGVIVGSSGAAQAVIWTYFRKVLPKNSTERDDDSRT